MGFNKKCNGYREISQIRQICLVDKSPLEDNFYRTDLSFGDAQGKSPLTCIGIETFMKIKKAGFKGVYFDKIFDRYEKLPDLKKQIEAFNRLYKYSRLVDINLIYEALHFYSIIQYRSRN